MGETSRLTAPVSQLKRYSRGNFSADTLLLLNPHGLELSDRSITFTWRFWPMSQTKEHEVVIYKKCLWCGALKCGRAATNPLINGKCFVSNRSKSLNPSRNVGPFPSDSLSSLWLLVWAGLGTLTWSTWRGGPVDWIWRCRWTSHSSGPHASFCRFPVSTPLVRLQCKITQL